jgi:SAM-dependent methyltransferase
MPLTPMILTAAPSSRMFLPIASPVAYLPAMRTLARRRSPESAGAAGAPGRLYVMFVMPLRSLNARLRALSAVLHRLQYKIEGLLGPAEWFDHEIDVQWQWAARQRPMFLERGVLNMLAISPGARVLEICCGDGFYAHRFYAGRAANVLAVDRDASALSHARRFHARDNVEYRVCNIVNGIPEGPFDNVIWDSAIHHFTARQVTSILGSVHRCLVPGGVLSGYTEIAPNEEYAYARMHFTDPEQLAELLAGAFEHVAVLETPDALRRNLYFFASDAPEALPFASGIHRSPASRRSGAPASPA